MTSAADKFKQQNDVCPLTSKFYSNAASFYDSRTPTLDGILGRGNMTAADIRDSKKFFNEYIKFEGICVHWSEL